MDWNDFLKDTNAELAEFRGAQKDVASGFHKLAAAATAEGALDPKTKELMAVAIGIAVRCDGCIGFHVKAAMRLGATREEIAETVSMCLYMGGGPSLMYGAKALKAFDDFREAGAA
ncbi:carboxymuconolactone decarboxylase family protein [Rhodovulum sp. DZ06]|uniref:carboxymuconolactone decarboxylase family protein n=1 Tax=Rhodovulum sp. DZ06 TaxID=3425126 RepID=UPI003D3404FB